MWFVSPELMVPSHVKCKDIYTSKQRQGTQLNRPSPFPICSHFLFLHVFFLWFVFFLHYTCHPRNLLPIPFNIITQFLGGLSLHLNHLIASRTANYDWPFGTLPFGLFWSNLDTRDLETYPRTYSGHFWNMSIFDDSRAVWVLFRKWVVSENQSFLDEGVIVTPLISLVLGGEVPRLNHGPICCPIQNT